MNGVETTGGIDLNPPVANQERMPGVDRPIIDEIERRENAEIVRLRKEVDELRFGLDNLIVSLRRTGQLNKDYDPYTDDKLVAKEESQ